MAHPDQPAPEWIRGNRTGGECALIPLAAEPKSAAWKIALAAWLKRRCSAPNRGMGEQPHRDASDAVSRYVGDVNRGDRAAAAGKIHELTPKIRG